MPEGELLLRGWTGTTTVATGDLASQSDVAFYVKGNKIVIAYNKAGTLRYLTYDMTASAGTWADGTTSP